MPAGPGLQTIKEEKVSVVDGGYTVQTISNQPQLLSIEEEWRRLYSKASTRNVFTSFEWVSTWWEHFGRPLEPRRQLFIKIVWASGRIVGIAPLMKRRTRRAGIEKIELIGVPFADFQDFLVEPGEEKALLVILKHLAGESDRWGLMECRQLSPALVTCELLEKALNQLSLRYRRSADDECPLLEIKGDWEHVLQDHSRRTRHTYRNLLRRAKESGVTIRVLDGPPQIGGALDRLIELDGAKWAHNTPVFRPLYNNPGFFKSLLGRLSASGQVYTALMEKSGVVIAGELGFKAGKGLWCYWRAYDAVYASLSPGTLLLGAVVDDAFRNGFSEYDFTRGDEAYKKRWARKSRQNSRFLIWHDGSKSRAAAFVYRYLRPGVDRAISAWKQMREPPK